MILFTVFSKRVAGILCNQGFRLIKTGINNQYPKYKVYFFEDTPEFRAALERVSSH